MEYTQVTVGAAVKVYLSRAIRNDLFYKLSEFYLFVTSCYISVSSFIISSLISILYIVLV